MSISTLKLTVWVLDSYIQIIVQCFFLLYMELSSTNKQRERTAAPAGCGGLGIRVSVIATCKRRKVHVNVSDIV
jgi:hypothetical protein